MKSISEIKPGVCFDIIARVVTKLAEANGYSVVYQFCGHGVGLEFHEPPQIQYDYDYCATTEIMQPGMIFTVEPMINEGGNNVYIGDDNWTVRTCDKKLSAQYEHTVLVTDDGVEILTQV